MSPRYENLNRLKEILQKRSLTISEMASSLNTSDRTIYRYIDTLIKEDDGLVKKNDNHGKDRYCYQVDEIENHKHPALENLLMQLSESGNHAAAAELEKLMSGDSDNKDRLINPSKHFYFDNGPFAEHKALKKKKRHSKVIEAIDQKKILKLNYKKEDRKESLTFFPCKYVLRMGRLYLLGYQQEDPTQLRILADERILGMSSTGQGFSQSTVIDPVELYKFVFGQYIPVDKKNKPEKIVLSVSSPWLKSLLSESHFNPPAKFIEKSNQLEVHLELYITSEFTRWLVGCLADLSIVKPLSLKKEIKEILTHSLDSL